MYLTYLLIFGSWALFGISAIWALIWAIQQRQFEDPGAAARSILDADEREAELNDWFPGEEPEGRHGR
jgi:cbb3-type cytochrome oxidase maturation protein